MSRLDEIAKAFNDRGIDLAGSVVKDLDANRHLVFVSVDSDDEGTQIPSIRALSKVERAVEEEFGAVTVVPVRRADDGISPSIKTMLFRKYPNQIRSVFSSVDRKSVSVWVETKSPTTKERSDEMKEAVAEFIGYFHLELIDFINASELNLPSETTCIGAIRKLAPVTVPDISAELKRLGFEIPGEQWIGKILDRWRKNKLIHRKANGQFVMTVQGLKALGSKKNRRSPDVRRALDMARREC